MDDCNRAWNDAHRMRALPSKRRLGSLSSSLSSSRAARRILDSVKAIRQISRLFLRPYSPASFISASRRGASKGRLGTLAVLLLSGKGGGY